MSTDTPVLWRWDGEAMHPLSQVWAKRADQQFVIGETYRMEAREERSARSHSHYFACVHEAWMNLPEHEALRYPTAEHLRKYALVMTGYRDERTIACASKAEAERVAAFVRPMDDYAVVSVREAVVRVWTAKSQSVRAMGKKPFQESKTKVLDFLADLIGADPTSLSRAA